MDSRITAVLLVIALGGGGYAGWRLYNEMGQLRIEVAFQKSEVERAKGEAKVAKDKLATVEKDLEEQKIALVGMRAERDSSKVLLEGAQRQNERMAQELMLASQQLAYLRARAGGGGVSSQIMPPQVIRERPMIIQAVPAPRPQSNAVAAPVPGQGYSPPQGYTGGRP